MHVAAEEVAVGSGEVDELEETEPGRRRLERAEAPHPAGVDDHHLPRVYLSRQLGPHQIEGGRLRREHPAPGRQLTEAQRPEAMGVADSHQAALIHHHQGEGPGERGQNL